MCVPPLVVRLFVPPILALQGAQFKNMVLSLLLVLLLLGALIVGIILPTNLSSDTQTTALGGVAVACNGVMFALPILQLRIALRSMNPAAIPFALTATGLALSGLWLAYGLLINNWFVAGPNSAGVFFSTLQLIVAAYISCRTRMDPSLIKPLEEGGEGGEGDEEEGYDVLGAGAGPRSPDGKFLLETGAGGALAADQKQGVRSEYLYSDYDGEGGDEEADSHSRDGYVPSPFQQEISLPMSSLNADVGKGAGATRK